MLKQISQVDLSTFAAQKPATIAPPEKEKESQPNRTGFEVFEGNIEEQARILCKQFMKREIVDHQPEEKSEAANGDDSIKGQDEDKDMIEEVHENGHDEASANAVDGLLDDNNIADV